MDIKISQHQRVEITGLNSQRDRAFRYLEEERYSITSSGPARGKTTPCSDTRYRIVAERPLPMVKALPECHDCGAKPGQPHEDGCDVERCSVCGGQRLCCGCKGHDRLFARWTGIWPGDAESRAMGIDLNEFYRRGFQTVFFVKPKKGAK